MGSTALLIDHSMRLGGEKETREGEKGVTTWRWDGGEKVP